MLVRTILVIIAIIAYLFIWIEAHFIRTDPCFRKEVNEFIIATACVFDVFNIFMLIVAIVRLAIWAWS